MNTPSRNSRVIRPGAPPAGSFEDPAKAVVGQKYTFTRYINGNQTEYIANGQVVSHITRNPIIGEYSFEEANGSGGGRYIHTPGTPLHPGEAEGYFTPVDSTQESLNYSTSSQGGGARKRRNRKTRSTRRQKRRQTRRRRT
jgi:hypothetical protein